MKKIKELEETTVENAELTPSKNTTQGPQESPQGSPQERPQSNPFRTERMKDDTLRPSALKNFLGQEAIKQRIEVTLTATKIRNGILPHQLLAGPPGLGKTTLAQILATEMGRELRITSGPSLEKPGDLAGTLVGLKEGDVLFIDEIHRMPSVVEEFLYPAMEDQKLDILVGEAGGTSKTIRIPLAHFTLIGATTKPGSLSGPLRSRFQTIHKLEPYTSEELAQIASASAERLGITLHTEAAQELARRARGTPRIVNNHLLWVRDYALAASQQHQEGKPKDPSIIDPETAAAALTMINVDASGLDPTDRNLLEKLVLAFKGGPVGLSSLAVACGEDPQGVEEMNEPYLISQGYIKRTHNGRVALGKAYQALGITPPITIAGGATLIGDLFSETS
jgi:Holliday junction DNA helicase RuvB